MTYLLGDPERSILTPLYCHRTFFLKMLNSKKCYWQKRNTKSYQKNSLARIVRVWGEHQTNLIIFFQDLISSYSLALYQSYALSPISIYILTTYWLDRVILLARRKYMLITCECERAYYCKQVLNSIQNMTAKEKETCTYSYYFTLSKM